MKNKECHYDPDDIKSYTGCAKKHILNIYVKSEGINIFSQKIA